jgi:AcrR family transcriptional regulator
MTTTSDRPAGSRTPLTRERVLRAAVEMADRAGLEALSMRKLGQALGVEAMSLYNHVANKDDLLDGIVEEVMGEFVPPREVAGDDWRVTVRRCAIVQHEVLLRHPWVAALAESRQQAGPQRLAYYDALMGFLRDAGFSSMGTYRANLMLDSFIYGFVLQEVSWPTTSGESEYAAAYLERVKRQQYPNIVAVAELAVRGEIDLAIDFEVGLNLILESLERLRQRDLGA